MKSQKQTNKAPRPFKMGQSERGWSGGRQHKAVPPPVKSILAVAKQSPPAAKESAAPPAAE